ncbi:ATP-binding protein [Sphaerisporangium flaviroseum]|uniref:ATP-binding protein n=1 Tax=Sphaerisporangium flaviroseum TaxID=509199 RepID=UPI0031E73743
MLFYLIVEGTAHTRPALAGLLWSERTEANARGSLRLALMELRRAVGDHLVITRTQAAFDRGRPYSLDWDDLVQRGSVPGDYRGGFLDDLAIPDVPRFDDWIAGRRWQAEQAATRVLGERARAARDRGEHDEAVRLARRVLEIDPLDESAHRSIVEILSAMGNRAGALAQYEACRRTLEQELGVAPDPHTQALRQRIATPGHRAPVPAVAGGPGTEAPSKGPSGRAGEVETGRPCGGSRRRLPRPLTELIGRDAEIERVSARLRDPRVRLLTLTGPGGAGKTRLAIAVAERSDTEVQFVSFAGVRPPNDHVTPTGGGQAEAAMPETDAVVTTLAGAIGVDLTPPRPARDLLLAALRDRHMILVLDNLEHLPAAAPLAGAILSVAPAVRILATSRRRLGICAEHVHEVPALPDASARALFVDRARKLDTGFDPDACALARICAAVGGLPLAIELAASLTRALTCGEIADRLEAGDPAMATAGRAMATSPCAPADLLEHPAPAAAVRHASMKQVFDASWRLLNPPEQQALAAVSVFGGGFTLAAALEVAATTAVVLVRLTDHSLVRRDHDGRYRVHELVRQYAVARLADDGPPARHAAWYARFLRERAARLRDHADSAVLGEIEPEMDDIRLAWRYAGSDRAAFAEDYWTLCLRRHYYEEALSVASDMIAAGSTAQGAEAARWHRLAGIAHFQIERGGESLLALTDALAVADRPLPATRIGKLMVMAGALARQVVYRTTPVAAAAPRAPERALATEAARTLSLLTELSFHRQDQATMLLTVLRHLDMAERAGTTVERAEAYANFAVVTALAGCERVSRHYGRLADEAIAEVPDPVAVSRARLARGLRLAAEGRFAEAQRALTLARSHPVEPRLAEHCHGLLADLEVQRGRYATAVPLMAAVAAMSVARMGDELSGYWCLTGQAEAMLRLADCEPADVAAVLKAAGEATFALRTLDADHFARAGAKIPTIQRVRLGTARARLCLLGGDLATARLAVHDALCAADRPDMPLAGTLEAWAGIAEVLWALDMADAAIPAVLRHMARLARRTPSAAARMGWAAALLLHLTGRRPAAARSATRGLAAARRLGIVFDEARSREALGDVEQAARLHRRVGTMPLTRPR